MLNLTSEIMLGSKAKCIMQEGWCTYVFFLWYQGKQIFFLLFCVKKHILCLMCTEEITRPCETYEICEHSSFPIILSIRVKSFL